MAPARTPGWHHPTTKRKDRVGGIFETSIQQVNSSIGTSSVLIWNPENGSTTTFGPLGSVPPTAVLRDVVIVNTGTVTVFAGSGSLTAGSVSTALAVPAGGKVIIGGYNVTSPSGTTGQIWGNTTTGIGSTLAGLASVSEVV